MKRATNSIFGKKYEIIRSCPYCSEIPRKAGTCGCGYMSHPLRSREVFNKSEQNEGDYAAQYAYACGYHD